MLKTIKTLIIITILISCVIYPLTEINYVYAVETGSNMILDPLSKEGTGVANQAGYATVDENSAKTIVAKIVQSVLGLVGILFLIMIIYSGFQWMTSGGNEEKIAGSKKRIINATIGLIVVILSYTISYFIMWVVYKSNGVV